MLREELLALVDLRAWIGRSPGRRPARAGRKPAVVLVVGVNGTGKTTTTGKLARVLVADGRTVLLGAADTFRAAAADQLQTWGERVGVPTVRGAEGADPASVAFEAVQAGIDDGVDVVLVDTAGRLHTKTGLMDELGKVKRVIEKQGAGLRGAAGARCHHRPERAHAGPGLRRGGRRHRHRADQARRHGQGRHRRRRAARARACRSSWSAWASEVGARPTPRWPTSSRPQRLRAAGGRRPERLGRASSASPRTASAMQNGIDEVKHEPGLQSVASATGTPASSSRRASGIGRPGRELRARQQGRDRRRPGQRVDVGVGEVGAVVDAGRAELDGEPHARARAELVGVQPRPPARARARPSGSPGPGRRRRPPVAEHVDPPRVRRAGVEHRAGHQVDVASGSSAYSGGTTCAPRNVVSSVTSAGDRQAAGLVGDGEPVAALDLDRRGALALHLGDEPAEVRGELLVGRRAGRGDRGADAAGGVGLAGHPGRELGRPVAGEHQVRVAVDEARGSRRGRRRRRRARRQPRLPPRPRRRTTPSVDDERRVGDASPSRAVAASGRW